MYLNNLPNSEPYYVLNKPACISNPLLSVTLVSIYVPAKHIVSVSSMPPIPRRHLFDALKRIRIERRVANPGLLFSFKCTANSHLARPYV